MLRVSAPPSRCSGGRAEGDVATPGICTQRGWLGGGDREAESAGGNPAICSARGLRRPEAALPAVFRPGHSSVTASQPRLDPNCPRVSFSGERSRERCRAPVAVALRTWVLLCQKSAVISRPSGP